MAPNLKSMVLSGFELADLSINDPAPYTLHSTPCALHPAPYTLHPTPCTLHPTLNPQTLHPAPYTLQTTPLHPDPETGSAVMVAPAGYSSADRAFDARWGTGTLVARYPCSAGRALGYRVTSLTRRRTTLGPYRRLPPSVLGGS